MTSPTDTPPRACRENSSYRLRDFQRLLTGGYDEDGNHDEGTVFMGDTVTVANNDTLPTVYGSLRAYFDSVRHAG